jgi:N-methylhydantoinase A
MARYVVAVDVGGTFTDLIAVDLDGGGVRLAKVPSTPPDFHAGVVAAIAQVSPDFGQVALFVHGTTAHLNAFLERKGAHCALLTTRGFGDVYEMRRGARPRAYDLQFRNPDPLICRRDIFELSERVNAQGDILEPLDVRELDAIIPELRRRSIRSVAICFLHSYRNPVHEERCAAYLRKAAPEMFVTPSVDVCREWREYERTSTVAMNAYLSPILGDYLRSLRSALQERGFRDRVHLMQSHGGLIGAQQAESRAVLTLMSGPVGGNVGCRTLSRQIDEPNLICVDMGGTSFDISLVIEGESAVAAEKDWAGQPVLAPTVDIHTIGAGGGSIARIDSGALRVGPYSAGAVPGPACYGRGGCEPTVTDANLLLGRLDAASRFGGSIGLQADRSSAVVARLGTLLGLTPQRMAEGILDVINAQMANAIRTMTISRGIDPRSFALVAFGGAGPMHAVFLAAELGIRRVIVPGSAGAFSAWGMLETQIRHDRTRAHQQDLTTVNPQDLEPLFLELQKELSAVLMDEGIGASNVTYRKSLDMRYAGQEHFINVPISTADTTLLRKSFDSTYKNLFGHSNAFEHVEIVNLRIQAHGPLPSHGSLAKPMARKVVATGEAAVRDVVFDGRVAATRCLDRSSLSPVTPLEGPLIIHEPSCTTVIPPGWRVTALASGELLAESVGDPT